MKDFWMFDRNLSIIEQKLEALNLSLYPNPCSDYCLFDFHNQLDEMELAQLSIQLISLDGKTKMNQAVISNQTKIDIEKLQTGIYLYSIEINHISIKTGQLIITN